MSQSMPGSCLLAFAAPCSRCATLMHRLLVDGFTSLVRGNPNMNSLVAVGSTASFTVGAASALSPTLGGVFDAGFLEEPVMLLAFVLLGRALEARAKVGGKRVSGSRHLSRC